MEQIILATLHLASKQGLGNVSLQMIADEVGIKKASLFNHIQSKDDLIDKMYEYLRDASKQNINMAPIDFSLNLEEILYICYMNYFNMCKEPNLNMFYRVIYSERAFNNAATQIVINETEKMISAIKKLFIELENVGKMKNLDIDLDSIEFAFTIHNFVDYEIDCCNLTNEPKLNPRDYISAFAKRHQ